MKRIAALSMIVTVLTAGLGFASPAGVSEPFRVRTVTMNGVSGPAYYSRAAGTFRFLPQASGSQMAALRAP
ncbi:hypothetical protein NS365_16270 [Aureimonas ureilytica]|uniref:Uncharacterized protein n=1 Tax=Aureimonas ureilytica TaxID=401562 RepID=A0A175RJX9_9HYPH|nr:hypothetical protein [Aureimonas ureilytica]KTR04070.1 hypothetical protein NS365_16270 [Aureimonas ureilytica]